MAVSFFLGTGRPGGNTGTPQFHIGGEEMNNPRKGYATLHLMQWNVWINEDPRNTAALIGQYQPDVACLQELAISGAWHGPNHLASLLGYHVAYVSIPPSKVRQEKRLANVILSRFPVIAKRTALINEPWGGGGYDDEYRGYVEATIRLPNATEVAIGTAHMSYTSRFQETARKRQETARLVDFLGDCAQRRVLTGDFNSLPGSYTIDTLSKIMRHVGPDFSQPTWTTKRHLVTKDSRRPA